MEDSGFHVAAQEAGDGLEQGVLRLPGDQSAVWVGEEHAAITSPSARMGAARETNSPPRLSVTGQGTLPS